MKKILYVASECYPFVKTGGLGDVAFALPKTLRKYDVDIRVILPNYEKIPQKYKDRMTTLSTFNVYIGWRRQYVGLKYLVDNEVTYYFIDNEYYFKRENLYGYYDDGERFSYFDKAVLESIKYMGDFTPNIIHCNDWQTGAIMPLLEEHYISESRYSSIKTVFSIHNIEYQGIFPKECLGELLNLPWSYFSEYKMKYLDAVSFMKSAINMSGKVSTVSPSYAEEIKSAYYGQGLQDIINYRQLDLFGILNGIDVDLFDPKTDKEIYSNYDENTISKKVLNKTSLQAELGLPVDENIPMLGMVGRLVAQKGLELLIPILHELLELPIQIVLLGTGDKHFEDFFRHFADVYPNKLSINIFYEDSLSRKIYAASDIFLMPSKFEPCGISQLIALRYGSIPIVRETGGLKDTIVSYDEHTKTGNGFTFTNFNAHDFLYTIKRAIHFYHDKDVWELMVKRAMEEDNSWDKSAKKYIEMYSYLE